MNVMSFSFRTNRLQQATPIRTDRAWCGARATLFRHRAHMRIKFAPFSKSGLAYEVPTLMPCCVDCAMGRIDRCLDADETKFHRAYPEPMNYVFGAFRACARGTWS